jgi:hypothetical protein
MYDSSITKFYDTVYKQNPVHNDNLVEDFKSAFMTWLGSHELNDLKGYDVFPYRDICIGCTQFIDDIYQRIGTDRVMVFENEYRYHWRLNNDIRYVTLDTLDASKELIISMPFPAHGDVHPQMKEILDRCSVLNIPVHVDGAWVSCCRDISFDFDHPAIKTFAISLSKGGLGSDRIALRFARTRPSGAITIMNDFSMNCHSLLHIGTEFMQQLGPEYFWKKYREAYDTVCRDFGLVPTKAIHLAKTIEGQPVGIRPLLRCIS